MEAIVVRVEKDLRQGEGVDPEVDRVELRGEGERGRLRRLYS